LREQEKTESVMWREERREEKRKMGQRDEMTGIGSNVTDDRFLTGFHLRFTRHFTSGKSHATFAH